MKRLFDLILSAAGVVLVSPVLLAVAYIIKFQDGGPVFYRGWRIGRFGKPFRIFKFRTMTVNAEKLGGSSTSADDSRITKIGRFLRKYKLDEMPQLLNVLKGDMSVVGPRPEVKQYTDLYSEDEKIILTVRPGITDWASMWNSDEGAVLAMTDDPDKAYFELIRPTKLKLQMQYVKERSFLIDLKIIFETLMIVMSTKEKVLPFSESELKEYGYRRTGISN